MFKLAHISDCHIGPLPRVKTSQLLNKRLTGFLNWRRHRSHVHKRDVLDKLCSDLKSREADHIAVTGDLVNLALPAEFEQSAHWLRELGSSQHVSLVPGNHDAYLRLNKGEPGMTLWSDYMASDRSGTEICDSGVMFPYVRFLAKNIALIGLSSAVPTLPFRATGTLGDGQLQSLQHILETLRGQDIFTIILIHHPPLPGMTKNSRALTDAGALEKQLRHLDAGLVLFGHNHVNARRLVETYVGKYSVVGVPSASCAIEGKEPLARYNIYHIARDGNQWECHLQGWGFRDPGGKVQLLEEVDLFSVREISRQPVDL